ncbi:MAG: hypothetical protein ACKOFW_08615 [Planctomycetaceae bacterium]
MISLGVGEQVPALFSSACVSQQGRSAFPGPASRADNVVRVAGRGDLDEDIRLHTVHEPRGNDAGLWKTAKLFLGQEGLDRIEERIAGYHRSSLQKPAKRGGETCMKAQFKRLGDDCIGVDREQLRRCGQCFDLPPGAGLGREELGRERRRPALIV